MTVNGKKIASQATSGFLFTYLKSATKETAENKYFQSIILWLLLYWNFDSEWRIDRSFVLSMFESKNARKSLAQNKIQFFETTKILLTRNLVTLFPRGNKRAYLVNAHRLLRNLQLITKAGRASVVNWIKLNVVATISDSRWMFPTGYLSYSGWSARLVSRPHALLLSCWSFDLFSFFFFKQ